MLYNRYLDFITVKRKIEAKIWIFSHSLSLDFFLHFLTLCLIGDVGIQ